MTRSKPRRATPPRSRPIQQLPRVRVLFDNGAGSATPGNPLPGFEHSFSTFPIPGTQARSWYFGAGGSLTDGKPTQSLDRRHLHLEQEGAPADRLHRPHRR